MPHTAFYPDASYAKQLDIIIKQRLAGSLEYIGQQTTGHFDFSSNALDHLTKKLRAREAISPAIFALYYDLIISIEQDDLSRAREIFSLYAQPDFDTPQFSVRSLSPADLGQEKYEIYKKFADCDPETPLNLIPPSQDDFEKTKTLIEEAMKLLDKAVPELANEIRGLLCEVIVATNTPSTINDDFDFGGVSSVYLWGAIFLNVCSGSVLQVVETLVHESAHMHLFALSMDGDIVLNPYDQRLDSPLRDDPRPMDGIYHATYVLGRMHYGIKTILESGLLDECQQTEGQTMLLNISQSFKQGVSTVETSADLTERGQKIMAETRAYMLQAGGL